MDWWLWLIIGIAFLVSEIVTPGALFLLFFGFGAVITGVLTLLHISGGLEIQIGIWIILSVLLLVGFRKRLVDSPIFRSKHRVDSLVGESCVTTEEIIASGVGRVELRGTTWSAKNTGHSPLAIGARCRVISVDGLTLNIHAE